MKFNEIPHPRRIPLFGNVLDFKPQFIHKAFLKWAKDLGSVYKLHFFHKKILVFSNPHHINTLMRERPKKYKRVSVLGNVITDVLGPGLFSSEGNDWKRQKRLMNRAFTDKQMINFFPILLKITERFGNHIRSLINTDPKVDIKSQLANFSIDVTTSFAFGYDGNITENSTTDHQRDFSYTMYMINRRSLIPWPYWKYFKLPKDRKLDQAKGRIFDLIDRSIKDAKSKLGEGKEPTTILDTMILAGEDEEYPFTDEELKGNVVQMLFAGEDTSSTTLTWALYFLAIHPEYVEKLSREFQSLPPELDNLTFEHLKDLPLLEAVIFESLRLFPVSPFLFLESLDDGSVGDVEFPAGTPLVVLFQHNYLDETYFPEPTKFNPERWLDIDPTIKKDIFHPFGSGPRICPGRHLGLMEIKVLLIHLIQNFRFELETKKEEIQDELNFTLAPNKLVLKIKNKNPP